MDLETASQVVSHLQEWINLPHDLANMNQYEAELIPTANLSYSEYTLAVCIGDIVVWDDQLHGGDDSPLTLTFCLEEYRRQVEPMWELARRHTPGLLVSGIPTKRFSY